MKTLVSTPEMLNELYDSWAKPGALQFPCVIEVMSEDEHRSLPQNNLSFEVYLRIAKHLGDSPQEIRRLCKLEHGVMILRRDDLKFRKFYNTALINLTYEEKKDCMEFTPITSLMKKKQKQEYLTSVMDRFTLEGVAFGDLS